jgi:hypothetical protein
VILRITGSGDDYDGPFPGPRQTGGERARDPVAGVLRRVGEVDRDEPMLVIIEIRGLTGMPSRRIA